MLDELVEVITIIYICTGSNPNTDVVSNWSCVQFGACACMELGRSLVIAVLAQVCNPECLACTALGCSILGWDPSICSSVCMLKHLFTRMTTCDLFLCLNHL